MDPEADLALEWGQGNPRKRYIAQHLSSARLSSIPLVYIDSVVFSVLFGKDPDKPECKQRIIQVLLQKPLPTVEPDQVKKMKQLFQETKVRVNEGEGWWYVLLLCQLAQSLWNEFQVLREGSMDSLRWVLQAYTVLVLDSSDVKMQQMGRENLGVIAKRDFIKGEYIYELMGIMPIESKASHSDLSTIRPHPSQGERNERRVLTGPLRLLNHRCQDANAQFVAVDASCAFALQTTRAIVRGEEIVVNYGRHWFGSKCPCVACVPPSPALTPNLKLEEIKRREAVKARRVKRRGTKKRAKKHFQHYAE